MGAQGFSVFNLVMGSILFLGGGVVAGHMILRQYFLQRRISGLQALGSGIMGLGVVMIGWTWIDAGNTLLLSSPWFRTSMYFVVLAGAIILSWGRIHEQLR